MSPRAFLAPVLLVASISPGAAAQTAPQALLPVPTPSAAVGCQPQWVPTFGGRPGVGPFVETMSAYDDGSGPALFLGGRLGYAGGTMVSGVVRWDGAHWSTLAGGVGGVTYPEVFALAGFDDGSGPAVYAGGFFTTAGGVPANDLARWDGTQWSQVGGGVDGIVRSLLVFDDGTGPALYAGGEFLHAGGVTVNHIAKWNGTSWSPLGLGTGNTVAALAAFDDGSGPALYAAGYFGMAGGAPALRIAKWDGAGWSPLGSGISGIVFALAVYDDGSGRALYAGGWFGVAGTTSAYSIAKWDGANWSALGSGVDVEVDALGVFDDGSGPKLFVGGIINHAGGVPVQNLASWDGNQWSALSPELLADNVHALTTFDDGHGHTLFVGGSLNGGGGVASWGVARWNGQGWSALTDGGLDWAVRALASCDLGTGPALFAGGSFEHAGEAPLRFIGRWNGTGWAPLGPGLDGSVAALASLDEGSGTVLYAGGSFTNAGSVPLHSIGRWNGSSWSPVGLGMNGSVSALCVHDDGGGPSLYAGGSFTIAGHHPANRIARWDGSAWVPLGSGLSDRVDALATFDDGSGPALYAGGRFVNAGGITVNRIARWNGSTWSGVGGGTDGDVHALAVFDPGSGAGLYAGGFFWNAGGAITGKIARWDASGWSALGNGVGPCEVTSLCSYTSVVGPRLLVGGCFDLHGGGVGDGIAQWDGVSWSQLGNGVTAFYGVSAMAVHDDGSGPAAFAGGAFPWCRDSGDSFLAKWGLPSGCVPQSQVICEPGFGGVLACPCSNPPSSLGRGCDNSVASGGANLASIGSASLSSDALHFVSSAQLPSSLCVLLQGTATNSTGLPFGQGVRCVDGLQRRLYSHSAVQGALSVPGAGDPSVSARSAALGDPIAQGQHRYYGVFYRDPNVLGSCPVSSTFNITQQLDVLWQP